MEALDLFADPATYVLGHNLLGHDFPVLNASVPWLGLLKKPAIDTLYLSPLAFPHNPYHRLVKDYKLVRTAINSPVEDAKLAASVFADQWRSLSALAERNPAIVDFYRFCFQNSVFNGFPGMGLAAVFSNLTTAVIAGPQEAIDCFVALTAGKVCDHAVRQVLPDYLADPVTRHRKSGSFQYLKWSINIPLHSLLESRKLMADGADLAKEYCLGYGA